MLYVYATQALDGDTTHQVDIYNYSAIIVEMDESFRKSLMEGYRNDLYWVRIRQMIDVNTKLVNADEGASLLFVRGIAANANLIFYRNKDIGLERLYIL